jgi:excisionase family DNA binding protein
MSIVIKKPAGKPVTGAPVATKGKPKAFYTVAELAERWVLSERHIRRLIANQSLAAHTMGRAIRISASNVALFEARCTGDM